MSRMGWKRIEEIELQESDDPGTRSRLYFMRIFILIIFGLLLYRVYWLQQQTGDELTQLAEENQFAILRTDAPRGVIFDRNGEPLAINQSSFNVTITPAFLPDTEEEIRAVYERLSVLTGVPVTNTVQQEALIAAANPELVSSYTRMAEIYEAPVRETLDEAGIVPQLPNSIEAIVAENSFAQYVPAVITSGIPITLAYTIEQESIFLPGVRVIPEPLRYYPAGEYTAHIMGYMGPLPNELWLDLVDADGNPRYERDDRVGWSGLESSMEIELSGKKGERRIEQDWTGREVRQIGLAQEPAAGLNLHLTLDLELQKVATDILGQYLEANRTTARVDEITGEQTFPEIEQAAAVVLNPQTGEVLALVSYPLFDDNRFQTEVPVDYYLGLARNDYTPLVNHAITGTYPPGSTFKIVPGSAALQEGTITANRLLNAPGVIEIANRFAPNDPGRAQTFVCWVYSTPKGSHGAVNMYTGLANSCDIYFYKITGGFDQDNEYVEGVHVEGINTYGTQFGFGRVQGIELPLESEGNLPTRAWKSRTQGEPWSTGDDYNLGIGQGYMTATPLQVAQMGAVIANGGFLYRPTLIHHMTDENGNVIIVDENSAILAVAHLGNNGETVVTDADGNAIENSFGIRFNANGEYIFQPEVIDTLSVDREYIDVIAEGMRLVNTRNSDEEFYTGATYVNWLEDDFGIVTAGKTGTAEYCDNIAIERGWCRYEDIAQKRVLPTHAWYVGFAPFENPEIVVAVFTFNGGEGSAWSAPVACHIMAAYFKVGQYADPGTFVDGEPGARACTPTSSFGSYSFTPTWPLGPDITTETNGS
ncbi:MAG: penicillin-binding protein 2 [Ardenticatenaceae bacterium]|nr:penicillin-binding protein 2 [Ardenticatenaceae bacterium]